MLWGLSVAGPCLANLSRLACKASKSLPPPSITLLSLGFSLSPKPKKSLTAEPALCMP